jgi:hypothetical protein
MTGSRIRRNRRRLVGQSDSQHKFQDVCAKSGKWFLGGGELFRRTRRDETFAVKMRAI